MVALTTVRASNALLASNLPGLVAVFVGGTSGIGEFTLKAFAQNARKPRTYFIGRSQEAGDRIAAECKTLNPEGEFTFMKVDTSLIRNVDDVCREIKAREEKINILFLTTGTFARTGMWNPLPPRQGGLGLIGCGRDRREAPHGPFTGVLFPYTLYHQPAPSHTIRALPPARSIRLLRHKRRTNRSL